MQQVISTPGQTGHVLASRRKTLKLSQQAVALKLGISQNRLSELEEHPARLTLERFIALANILGLELVLQNKTSVSSTSSEW